MNRRMDGYRLMPAWLPLVAFTAALVVSPGAGYADEWSDKFDDTLDFSLRANIGQIEGDGWTALRHGGLLRGNLSLAGVRFGIGVGGHRVGGATPMADANHNELHTGGMSLVGEAFVGYALFSYDIRPYVELRGAWNMLRLDRRSVIAVALPPTTEHEFGFGVRAGVAIALSEYFYVDVGGYLGATGAERMSLSLALGLPIPLSNL